jgi:putative ATPase
LANPSALNTAVSAYHAAMSLGMPEARIVLAQAVITVAVSPKSNSACAAIDKALQDVANRRTGEIPMHLRNAPVKQMEELGYSRGYQYVHDFPGNYVDEEYLPAEIAGTEYYSPYSNGYEEKIKIWLDKQRARKKEHRGKADE